MTSAIGSTAVAGKLVAFGEILLRLSAPGQGLMLQHPGFDAHFGGAEANVAAAFAALGLPAAVVTILPDNPLGQAALAGLRAIGIDCADIRRRPGRMGLYFLEAGAGLRPGKIVYDRAESAFARIDPDAFDWPSLLRGAGRLHLSGITPALGDGPATAALHAAEAAARLNIPMSFDVNYRASLWQERRDAPALLRALAARADILFANRHDLALLLGEDLATDDSGDDRRAVDAAFAAFPKLEFIASSRRTLLAADQQRVSVRIDDRQHGFRTPERLLATVVDRIGTGDALSAGILAGLAPAGDMRRAADMALALFCLKHAVPGDVCRVGLDDVDAFLTGQLDMRR